MAAPTRGEIEAEIAKALVKFQREQQGRGPTDVRVHLIGDLVVARSVGIFTQTEAHLAATDEGRKLIRSARQELRAISRPEVEGIVGAIADSVVLRSYYDVDVECAEQVEVFVLAGDLEKRLSAHWVSRGRGSGRDSGT